jgi:uncharacterized protein (DUF58 family)
MPSRTWPKHAFRIASLVVPTWLAWYIACSAPHRDELTRAVTLALGPFWVLLAAALVVRTAVLVIGHRRDRSARSEILAQIDVLTASGSALAWLSAFAIIGAVSLGWASLAVVGLLGTGLFHVVVLLTFVALRGGDPLRGASVSRRFSADVVTEGDSVIEELRFVNARIPTGFRLFVTGRLGPRWPTRRHVLDASESGGEILLEDEIGPAIRGDHDAEALDVWLSDSFGLCRSMTVHVRDRGNGEGPAHLTVSPRVRDVQASVPLMERGIGPRAPRPTPRLPTEGSFGLREYQPGDDVRRIHWVRSLSAGELVVRLPDELPPDRPRVRLVLDTFFPEAFALSCDAPSELLDTIVGVWLGVGHALAKAGVRVTLVTAIPRGATVTTVRHELAQRAPGPALRLGAHVAWQSRIPVDELLTNEATFVVSRGVLTYLPLEEKSRWILVVPPAFEPSWPAGSSARLPYPAGSSDNRWSRRRRVHEERVRAQTDHLRALMIMGTNIMRPPPGSFVALPTAAGAVRLEALR